MALDELAGEGGQAVGLSEARQAVADQVVAAADELAVQQRGQLAADLVGQPALVEGGQRFGGGQLRIRQQSLDAPGELLLDFDLGHVAQEASVAPVFGFGAGQQVLVVAGDGGQPEVAQQERGGVGLHTATSTSRLS